MNNCLRFHFLMKAISFGIDNAEQHYHVPLLLSHMVTQLIVGVEGANEKLSYFYFKW